MAKAEAAKRYIQGFGVRIDMSHHSARGRMWEAFRQACIKRAGYRCVRCRRRGRLEVHHLVSLAKGGLKFSFDNVIVLCRQCHFDEHRTINPERLEWYRHLGIV